MTKFYSKSTGGFYPADMRADYEASGAWPIDAIEITAEAHAALMAGQSQGRRIVAGADGTPELADQPAPTQAQLLAGFTEAIQSRLDDFAKQRGYDGILSACTYATSTIPKFAAEGQRCVTQRDETWSASYALLSEVDAGTKPMPTLEEIIAVLPVLTWPA